LPDCSSRESIMNVDDFTKISDITVSNATLHTDVAIFIFNQPLFEFKNRIVKSRKSFLLISRFNTRSCFNDCDNEKAFTTPPPVLCSVAS